TLAPKMSCASGTPIVSVFFTEQKRAAMKSSLCNLAAFGSHANEQRNGGKQRDDPYQYFNRDANAVVFPYPSFYGITEGRVDDEQDYSVAKDVQPRPARIDPLPNKGPESHADHERHQSEQRDLQQKWAERTDLAARLHQQSHE